MGSTISGRGRFDWSKKPKGRVARVASDFHSDVSSNDLEINIIYY